MPDNEEQLVRNVSAEWIVPDTVSTQRATHIVVQKPGPAEFVVSFLEQRDPLLTGSLEEQLEQFYRVEKMSVVCVARLVLSPDKLIEFADTFNRSLDEFKLTKPLPLNKKEDE